MKLKQQMMKQGKASVASRSLPCLNRNNSIEPKTAPAKWGSQADNAETAQVRLCQTSQDKGFRWKIATSGFQFVSEGSKQWRQKLAKWAQEWDSYFFYKTLKESKARGEPQNYISITEDNFLERLKEELGSKWAYKNRETILAIEI